MIVAEDPAPKVRSTPPAAPAPSVRPEGSPATLRAVALYAAGLLALSLWADAGMGGALPCVLAALAAWNAVVAVLHLTGRSRRSQGDGRPRFLTAPGWFEPAVLSGGLVVVGGHLWLAAGSVTVLAATPEAARLMALLLGGGGMGGWFLAALAGAGQAEGGSQRLAPLRRLLLLLAVVQLGSALLIFLRLTAGLEWLSRWSWIVGLTGAILALEAGASLVAWFYQPRGRRLTSIPAGDSLLLAWAFQRDNPWRSLARSLEAAFGLQIGETRPFAFLQRTLEPALLGGALLLWLGTSLSIVPVDSTGVVVRFGRHLAPVLAPGIHLHPPWPVARVETVPTGRVQTLALGFDQDLERPILWAEPHYAGEKSLLVGRGDELLTISVPLHYRISDPVAFLQNTHDAAAALQRLGYRELLRLTATHTSLGLMVTDRAQVADQFQAGLQAAADRLQLGIEIVWVGLKDIHPPVAVAPAYQEVVSAMEEKQTLIDRERAESARTLQEAQSSAARLRLAADAYARERTSVAAGESKRFTLNAAAAAAAPEVFRARRTFEAAETGLREATSLLVVPAAAGRTEFFLGVNAPSSLLPQLAR